VINEGDWNIAVRDGGDKLKHYFEEDCVMLLKELTNYFITNSQTVFKIIRYSGKDYNDFGRFQECESLPDFNYILAILDLNIPNPISFGLCLPSVCKESDLNSLKPIIVPTLNQAIPDLFTDLKALNPSDLQLEYSNIRFVSSS
jgi:hypothetical protein